MLMEDYQQQEQKNNSSKYWLPFYLAIAFVLGMIVCAYLFSYKIVRVRSDESDKFSAVLDYLDELYVDSIDRHRLTEEAINAMLQYLDPHSVYVNVEDNQFMTESLQGEFEGIGVQYSIMNDTVMVIATISGGPSEKVGIRAGDRIVMVNDSVIAGIGIDNNKVVKLLRGKKGTKVEVGIMRDGYKEIYHYDIIRDKIPTYTVDVDYMIDAKTGYIKINQFGQTTAEEFENALKRLNAKGMQKLILDLRGNSGGYLDACVQVCDELLPKKELIVYTEGLHAPKESVYATSYGHFEQGDLVVLIDDFSASASEIVAGCVQDNDRGTIIGRRSFGKGLVQRQLDFKDKSSVRLTVARYHTPSGRCIQKTYKDGVDSYNEEVIDRYLHGEMDNKDSIKFDENLRYKTKKGRTVYGGGGIMPDVFVPLDRDSTLGDFYKIYNSGKIYNFAFDYVVKNGQQIKKKYPTAEAYVKNMVIDDATYAALITFYNKQSETKCSSSMSPAAKKEIKLWLKAFIGRNLYQDAAFYPIINQSDKVIQAALKTQKK